MLYGTTRVRSDRSSRPRDLHVRCPSCKGRALATKSTERDHDVIVGDCRTTWMHGDWSLRCDVCTFTNEGLTYVELPGPYYEVQARGVSLWAFNEQHLTMLLDLLEGRDVERHPYAWLASYADRDWLRRGARKALARAVRRQWGDAAVVG